MSNRQVIERYFQALTAGVLSGDFGPLVALFADDARMLPGDGRVLQGRAEITSVYGRPAPGFWMTPVRITEMGDQVQVQYEVGWLGLEEPVRGVDTFTIVDGRITSLRVGTGE